MDESSRILVCIVVVWQLVCDGSVMMKVEVGDGLTDNGGVGSVRRSE